MSELAAIPPTAAPRLRGELRRDEPLARHTSWRVGGPAARLIEAAGLKGVRIGGAEVSPKQHANFIINTGAASARDIASLIDRVQAEVERTSGIRLIPEVRRVGELS